MMMMKKKTLSQTHLNLHLHPESSLHNLIADSTMKKSRAVLGSSGSGATSPVCNFQCAVSSVQCICAVFGVPCAACVPRLAAGQFCAQRPM